VKVSVGQWRGKREKGGFWRNVQWLCEENEACWAGFWLERPVGFHSPTKPRRQSANKTDSDALREGQREEAEETGGDSVVYPGISATGSGWFMNEITLAGYIVRLELGTGAAVHDAPPDDVEAGYEIKSVVVEGASDGVEDYERSARALSSAGDSAFRQPLRIRRSLPRAPMSPSLNWPDSHTGPSRWTDQSVVPQWSWPLLGHWSVIPGCRSLEDTIHRRYGPPTFRALDRKGIPSVGSPRNTRLPTPSTT
jgi:hypothetical protein